MHLAVRAGQVIAPPEIKNHKITHTHTLTHTHKMMVFPFKGYVTP